MGASNVGTFVDSTIGMVEGYQNRKQEKKEIQARLDAERQKIALEKKKEYVQKSQYDTEQRNLLKRALATQRSRYGAGGTAGKSFSAKSVLKRLDGDAKRNLENYKELSDLRLEKLNNNLSDAETNALLDKKRSKLNQQVKLAKSGRKLLGN
ncbi:MAG: hypothetical protein JW812_03585 [Alphaproteobacteria bacterium]|nr:hypothetical protein [Alphaproteobacteria bacterium]MBN2779934.1 hypothetical protein [Alphaproteobacteria bacterium]